jgi:N-formylglutamate deformylase
LNTRELILAVAPGVYMRRDPSVAEPVVFEIPRSGAEYPRWFVAQASVGIVQKSISSYVEEIYRDVTQAGATWLYACFPNIVIDPNRHETDIDPQQLDGAWPEPLNPSEKTKAGTGLLPKLAGDQELYSAPLTVADAQRRLRELYRPYHAELARLLRDAKNKHGVAYHMSCHSMGSMSPATAKDADVRRSDFDLGDRNGATCEPGLVDVVGSCLKRLGYSVTSNKHFIGAEAVRKHGDPKNGIHSLQIEMNRSLYMDEKTREKSEGYLQLQTHMTTLALEVVAYARSKAR